MSTMTDPAPTWIVLCRDVSESVRIRGQAQVWLALVLDAATGLALAVRPGASQREVLYDACACAATSPAPGAPPPGRPGEVWARAVLVPDVEAALAAALADPPPVTPTGVIGEAEDILDSLVATLSGRGHVLDPPSPPQWRLLYVALARLADQRPWERWDDDQPMRVELTVGGRRSSWVAVVMGAAEIQRGLALYPGRRMPRALTDPTSTPEQATVPGSLLVFLDEADECPTEAIDKALREGWPDELDVFPACVRIDEAGDPAPLDEAAAVTLHGLTVAVLAHDGAAGAAPVTRGETGQGVRFTVRSAG